MITSTTNGASHYVCMRATQTVTKIVETEESYQKQMLVSCFLFSIPAAQSSPCLVLRQQEKTAQEWTQLFPLDPLGSVFKKAHTSAPFLVYIFKDINKIN